MIIIIVTITTIAITTIALSLLLLLLLLLSWSWLSWSWQGLWFISLKKKMRKQNIQLSSTFLHFSACPFKTSRKRVNSSSLRLSSQWCGATINIPSHLPLEILPSHFWGKISGWFLDGLWILYFGFYYIWSKFIWAMVNTHA